MPSQIDIKQVRADGSSPGDLLTVGADSVESVARVGFLPVKTYTWFQDSTKPYIEFKGLIYTVQDRIRFAGTNKRTPSSIKIIAEVDAGTTANFRIRNAAAQVVVELTGISNSAWAILDVGSIANLNATDVIWTIEVSTSAANKNVRVSSMDIEF